jgi:hypothetical protein
MDVDTLNGYRNTETVATIFGMIPLVRENLQSAAKLASIICKQVEVL